MSVTYSEALQQMTTPSQPQQATAQHQWNITLMRQEECKWTGGRGGENVNKKPWVTQRERSEAGLERGERVGKWEKRENDSERWGRVRQQQCDISETDKPERHKDNEGTKQNKWGADRRTDRQRLLRLPYEQQVLYSVGYISVNQPPFLLTPDKQFATMLSDVIQALVSQQSQMWPLGKRGKTVSSRLPVQSPD